ncbi:hypothetical protein SDRG_15717 [Saprolegnia diclina VS20]|uniref:F-box domain-containing protein n=1 Tax=Saprolegnia diclina (strain VS20) TaxID=1156394 RepID=T0PW13_SAPDV|nr:hypothetical protein SDRG_15717 [Saprolegnia diclina VS20]EQC26436.1 hypothetical protein SDRG_15717 [Saprolegnia diclina VS20]|eukprot:XP_008620121.1 hypothetical protein SDRG_15717 [Saprolegnia diclina VS20]
MDASSLLHVLLFVAAPTDALALLTALPLVSLPPPFAALLHLFQRSKHFEWPVPRVECAGNMHMGLLLAAMPILPAVQIEQPDYFDACLQAARVPGHPQSLTAFLTTWPAHVVSLAVPAALSACDSDELCRLVHECTRLTHMQVDVASTCTRDLLCSSNGVAHLTIADSGDDSLAPTAMLDLGDALRPWLQSTRARTLALNNLTLDGVDAGASLATVLAATSSLTRLAINQSDTVAQALLASGLQFESLSQLKVSFATVPGHYRLVAQLDATKLTHLDVRGDQQEDLSPLLAMVPRLPALTHLTLGYCKLHEAVAHDLAGAPLLSSARFFSIVWRTDAVLESLLAHLGRSPRLQNVTWRRCPQIARVTTPWMLQTLGQAQFIDCSLKDTFVLAIADELRARTTTVPLQIRIDQPTDMLGLESVAAVIQVLSTVRNVSVQLVVSAHFVGNQGFESWFWDAVRLRATLARVLVTVKTVHARHHCYLLS